MTQSVVDPSVSSRLNALGLFVWTVSLLLLVGCGRSTLPVPGGTPGSLRSGSSPLSDVQVTVHQTEGTSFRPLGFGVSGSDGSFQLYTTGASGPLVLTPGDYVCTLESAGAPVQIPAAFAQPATSPLKINWTATSDKLDLEMPAAVAVR